MRKRNLVICPNCKKQVLGEVDRYGHFLVMRFHKGMTRIIGSSFAVLCGACHEPVYIKKGGNLEGAISYQWFSRVFRRKSGKVHGTAGA